MRYTREPQHDRRIGWGDDFASDAWRDVVTNERLDVAPRFHPGLGRTLTPHELRSAWADLAAAGQLKEDAHRRLLSEI